MEQGKSLESFQRLEVTELTLEVVLALLLDDGPDPPRGLAFPQQEQPGAG
jgi:hypothetical protein